MKTLKITLMLVMLVVLSVSVLGINVATCADLENIAVDLTADYVLTGDIDCTSHGNFNPIGSYGSQFTGTLDGAGYTIYNLTVNEPTQNELGIFSTATLTGYNELFNFTVDGASITGKSGAILVGGRDTVNNIYVNDVTIQNSFINASNTQAGIVLGRGGIHAKNINIYDTTAITSVAGGYRAGGINAYLENAELVADNIVMDNVSIYGGANFDGAGAIFTETTSSSTSDINITNINLNQVYVNSSADFGAGLITSASGVQDVFIENITITDTEIDSFDDYNGFICGYCSQATITVNNVSIDSNSVIKGDSDTSFGFGRLLTSATVTVTNFNSNANAYVSANTNGGLVGRIVTGTNVVNVYNSSISGQITSTANTVGGWIGRADNAQITLNGVYSNITITSGNNVGAILAILDDDGSFITVNNSYFTGSVTGVSGVGLIAIVQGDNSNVTMTDSYSTVSLNGNTSIGAVADVNAGSDGTISFVNSFILNGSTNGTINTTGGFIGNNASSNETYIFTNSYWQNSSSSASACIGHVNQTDWANPTGCNVDDDTSVYRWRDPAYSPMSSWDFTTVWQSQINDTPCLQWQEGCTQEYINHSSPTVTEIDQVGTVTVTSTSYTTIITSTIEVPTTTNVDLTAIGDIEASGANTVANCRTTFDGVEYTNIISSPDNGQHKSFGKQSTIFNVDSGNYSLILECKKDSTSKFVVENSKVIVNQYIDQDDLELVVDDFTSTDTLTNSAYIAYDTISFNATSIEPVATSEKEIILKTGVVLNFTDTGTICYKLEIDGTDTPEQCRYGETGTSGSGSLFAVIDNITTYPQEIDIVVYLKSTTSNGAYSMTGSYFEIYNHIEEINSTDVSNSIINSTSYQTVASTDIIIDAEHASSGLLAYAGFSVESNSGSADMTFRLIIEDEYNGTFINRDVTSANQEGLVTLQQEFTNLSAGNYTVSLQALTSNSDATITGGNLVAFTNNELLAEVQGYYVYPFSSIDNSSLTDFNVTTQSDGSVYPSENGFVFIPLSVASENVTVSKTGFTSNITLNHNTSNDLNVTLIPDAPTLVLTLSPSDSIEQPTQSTVTGSGCPTGLTCNLYRDAVLVSNPDIQTLTAGSYVYVYNTSGNATTSPASVTDTLTVTAPDPTCSALSDQRVPFNESYTWNSVCYHINGLENVTVSCDDGFTFNATSLNGSNYNLTTSSDPIIATTECTITVNSFTGQQTVYTQTLSDASGAQLIYGVCPDTDLGFSMLWLMFVIGVTLTLAGFVLRIPLISFFGSLVGLFMGLYLIGCVLILGVIIVLISLFMAVYTMVLMPYARN